MKDYYLIKQVKWQTQSVGFAVFVSFFLPTLKFKCVWPSTGLRLWTSMFSREADASPVCGSVHGIGLGRSRTGAEMGVQT